MALSFRQIQTKGGSSSSAVVSFNSPLAANNALVVLAHAYSGSNISRINFGNLALGATPIDCGLGLITNFTNNGGQADCFQCAIFPNYGVGIAGGLLTVTVSGSGTSLIDVIAYEITGFVNNSFIDKVITAQSTSTTAVSVGPTGALSSNTDAAIAAAFSSGNISAMSTGGGLGGWSQGNGSIAGTNTGDGLQSPNTVQIGAEHQIVSATTGPSATATSSTNNWGAIALGIIDAAPFQMAFGNSPGIIRVSRIIV